MSFRQRERILKSMENDQVMVKSKKYIQTDWLGKLQGDLALYHQNKVTVCENLIVWESRIIVPGHFKTGNAS